MKSRRRRKRTMIAVIVIAALLVVYIVLSVLGARQTSEIPREPLEATADSTGLEYENVSFISRNDSNVLKGWYFPGDDDSVIVIVNGGFRNRVDDNSDTLGLTKALVKEGHSILLFDLRGRGESEGEGSNLNHIDEDIGGAVDYLENRGYTSNRICLMGFCSGAVQACIYASRNSAGVLILDGCFIDASTMVVRQAATIGTPKFISRMFLPGVFLMAKLIYGYEKVNPIDVIGDVQCPILFIHEENDEFTTREETERLYRTSSNPANEMWEVRDSEHSHAFRNYPEEYAGRISGFIIEHSGGMQTD